MPDIYHQDYIRINQEWRKLQDIDGRSDSIKELEDKIGIPLNGEYVKGVEEAYACDTGCAIYVIYHVKVNEKGEEEEEQLLYDFIPEDAVLKAQKYADEHDLSLICFSNGWL